MSQVRISAEAEQDIDRITAYTASTWGLSQTAKYLTRLEETFDLLAKNPLLGRPCESIRTGLRRFEMRRHVIFFLAEADGVFVVRVLHQQMLPTNYF